MNITNKRKNRKEATYIIYEDMDHVGIIDYTKENMDLVDGKCEEWDLILEDELPFVIKDMTKSETHYIINIKSKTTNK